LTILGSPAPLGTGTKPVIINPVPPLALSI